MFWSRKSLPMLVAIVIAINVPSCKTTDTPSASEAKSTSRSEARVDDIYCAQQAQNPRPIPNKPTVKAYALFSVILLDPFKYNKYFSIAYQLLTKNHARIVMRGVNFFNIQNTILEGKAPLQAFNIVEFPSFKNFDDFYCDPEYQSKVRKLRFEATQVKYSVLKEGEPTTIDLDSSSTKDNVKAFILFNDTVTDQAAYDSYLAAATKLAMASGGRRMLSGGKHIEFEGFESDRPDNLTLFVFPSKAKLREWYDSAAYQDLKKVRLKASIVKFVLNMDGFVP